MAIRPKNSPAFTFATALWRVLASRRCERMRDALVTQT
jgi:hypothetical protein